MLQTPSNGPVPATVLELLACACCHQPLQAAPAELSCAGCGRLYPVEDGIPILLAERARLGPA